MLGLPGLRRYPRRDKLSLAILGPKAYTGPSAAPRRLGVVGLSLIRQINGYPEHRGRLVIVKRKRRMTAIELKAKTPAELREQLLALKKEAFNLRFQQATGQLENTARMRAVRRDVARIMTVLNQQAAAAAN